MYHVTMTEQRERGVVPSILENIMRKRGYTAAELARASGVSTSTISLILSGKRATTTVANAAALARVLNVSVDYLMGLSETPQPTGLMLGELLLELTQVARELTPRRQRELLAVAQTYLRLAQDAREDPAHLMDDMLDLIEEYDGKMNRDQLLDLIKLSRTASTGGLFLPPHDSE